MHSRGDIDCNRGYEWWLLEEARARNPQVVTYALSWAVPEWVGDDNYYSEVCLRIFAERYVCVFYTGKAEHTQHNNSKTSS